MTSAKAAWSEGRRIWADPEDRGHGFDRGPYYARLWDYYSNQAFEDLQRYEQYRAANGLARGHRSIFNPATRIVKAYEGFIYGGVLTPDPKQLGLPEGVPLAVELGKATTPDMKLALGQIWKWGNWQTNMLLTVRYAAALGNTLVEVVDDIDEGKIGFDVIYPGAVKKIDLDSQGKLRAYTLEWRVVNIPPHYLMSPTDQYKELQGDHMQYVWRKEVTRDHIRFFKNNQPYDYVNDVAGGPFSEYANPYGFVPAVWIKHLHMGGDYGEPVIWASLAKIDQLNETASLAYDQIAKIIKAPILQVGNQAGAVPKAPLKKVTSEQQNDTGREAINVIKVPAGTELKALPLELGQALEWMHAVQAELEDDHPELALFRKLREHKGDLTGPGVSRMMGDVNALIYPSMAMYDEKSADLWSMAICMAAFRARDGKGRWKRATQTEGQGLFLRFDPEAYLKETLPLTVIPRPITEPSRLEEWTATQLQVTALTGMATIGFSERELQRRLGLDDKQIDDMADEKAEEDQAKAEVAMTAFDRGAGMGGFTGGGGGAPGRPKPKPAAPSPTSPANNTKEGTQA